jgi:hypothetical protein
MILNRLYRFFQICLYKNHPPCRSLTSNFPGI